MDFLFLFFMLAELAGLCFSVFRLYQLRTVTNLSVCAAQSAVIVFLVFTYRSGIYGEPFVISFSALVGVAVPCAYLLSDVSVLRKKVRDRFGLPLSRFLYQNDRNETLKNAEKEKYVDQILRPRIDNFSVGDILGEIRVERADTSKNIQKQLEAAEKKFGEGDIEGAYSTYETVEKVFNRSPSLYFNMGNLDYARGDFESAARCYRRAVECAGLKEFEMDDMSEKTGIVLYNLGNALFLSEKYGRAIDAYKNAAAAYPANADAFFNMSFCHAMDYEETGDTEKAVEEFRKLVADMPGNLHAWFHYGKCLLKMKNTAQAIECFKKVVGEELMFYEAWYRLAIAYDESGMTADAVKAYYTTIQIKPDFINAYNNLGVLLSTAGRHGEALKVLKNALRIRPGDAELIYNIGMTHYEAGRYEDALAEFLACSKLRPGDESALYMISLAHMNAGNPQESMEYLEMAIKKDSSIGAKASKERVFQKYINRDEYRNLFDKVG